MILMDIGILANRFPLILNIPQETLHIYTHIIIYVGPFMDIYGMLNIW